VCQAITYVIHAQGRPEEVCGIVITDEEYPALVAQRLIEKALSLFVARYPHSTIKTAQPNSLPLPELKELLAQYQNPGEADSILKIQKELDDTTQILHKAYEQVVGRGEKIDSLVAKSETLSAQSKMFYTQVGWSRISERSAANISVQAKKQNSCCVVM
jgi:synaptobrevin family protein YKT6